MWPSASLLRALLPFVAGCAASVALVGNAQAALEVQQGSGAAACPGQDEIRALIVADKPPARLEQANVLLSIERTGRAAWRADIRVGVSDEPVRERSIALRGACRDLVVASAVAIRLALDAPAVVPLRAASTDTAPPPPAAPSPDPAPWPLPADAPARASAPRPLGAHPPASEPTASPVSAPAARVAAPTVVERARPSAAPVPQRPQWEGSLGGAALLGVAPDVAPAVALGAARVVSRFSVGGEVTYAATPDGAVPADGVRSKAAALGLVACWRAGPLSACAPTFAGAVIVSASGFENVRTRAAPLAMAGLRVGVRFIDLGNWGARLDASALVHLVRTRAAVDDTRLWTMPPASLSAGISITRMFF